MFNSKLNANSSYDLYENCCLINRSYLPLTFYSYLSHSDYEVGNWFIIQVRAF